MRHIILINGTDLTTSFHIPMIAGATTTSNPMLLITLHVGVEHRLMMGPLHTPLSLPIPNGK